MRIVEKILKNSHVKKKDYFFVLEIFRKSPVKIWDKIYNTQSFFRSMKGIILKIG